MHTDALIGFVIAIAQSAAALPPLPAPLGLPAPATATDAPYAPQAIVPGGIVVPLYPAGSPHLKADRGARGRAATT